MSTETDHSARTTARVAGLLYLLIIICAGFAEGYVRSTLIVPGDAAATAEAIMASAGLFRLGLAADLIAFTADAAVAVLLYVLLAPVDRTVSMVAAAFRLLAHPAIAALNLVHMYAPLHLLGGADYLSAFQPAQLEALAMYALELHGRGYLIAGALFGVHCALLGYLLFRSDRFPRWLGVLLMLAAVGYLSESVVAFLIPAFEEAASTLVVLSAGVAEVALCLWLLIRGVRTAPPVAASA